MSWTEYFLLAFASIVWPILIVVVIAALRTSRPQKLLLAFLAGGLLTTIAIGLVLVNVLDTTSVGDGRNSEAPASVSIVAGALWDLAGSQAVFLGGAGFALLALLGLVAVRNHLPKIAVA